MSYNEADTRAKLIDPKLHSKGWTEEYIKREVTPGGIEIIGGRARRKARGRMDYTLRLKISRDTQPVAIALIEAKAEAKSPLHGLEQGKLYADCNRLNIRFVYSTNGHQFVEFDKFTGLTTAPMPMVEFPSPDELQKRYEQGMGFSLNSEMAKPLLVKYNRGEAERRYYQDAAIRSVFEKIAQGSNRALLSLATGAGKTFIAVNMLRRIADAGQLKKALFICDRDELRTQALSAFQNSFGTNAAAADSKNPQHNAKIIVATYQTLGIANDDDDSSFLTENYPVDYFSHIVIDECHRSAWGKWSQVLTRNPNAIQIGLTATPRKLHTVQGTPDADITSDNYKHFGEPVYEYDMMQAVEDGYLAACEIQKGTVNIDDTGLTMEEILKHNPKNAITGEPITPDELKKIYEKNDYESKIMLPDRVCAMCADLFRFLLKTGTPTQKTIIFCVRDIHADLVAIEMNNLYSKWCVENNVKKAEHYAFKCTQKGGGSDYIADMKGSNKDYFIATTVDLLSTGVDIPAVSNVVFFKYMKSPISFYQMVGRGTRLAENKLMFRIYDYTNATRLFGDEFITKPTKSSSSGGGGVGEPTLVQVDGIDIAICDDGKYVVTEVDGNIQRVPLEQYKATIASKVINSAQNFEDFRALWINPEERQHMLEDLVRSGYSPSIVRTIEEMDDFDLFDVLVDLAYGHEPKTRNQRAFSFEYKQKQWLSGLSSEIKDIVLSIANQFTKGGTEALESQYIWKTPEVKNAGGLSKLKEFVNPAKMIAEIKERIFAA